MKLLKYQHGRNIKMDYYERQQQLLLSPLTYREKSTVYLFSHGDKHLYTLNDNGICNRWENDYEKFLVLLKKIGLETSSINKKDIFRESTLTLIGEINNWLEWVLNADYLMPDDEKTKIYTFNVKTTMNKTYYTIAKICDNASSIDRIDNGYRVTFKGENLKEIELMYFLREGWDWNAYNKNEGIMASYLVKYSKLYRRVISSIDMLNQVNDYYGYYTIPQDIRIKVFYAIQKMTKQIQKEADELYTSMLLEKRVRAKWANEYTLFELVKYHNPSAQYQYHSEWLGKQSLDIYLDTERIGIEYQGEQHYKPVEIWGGEEGLVENKKRDLRKKALCEKNNVRLLEWPYQTPVNNDNVVQFMKENNIPLTNQKLHMESVDHEMAPAIEIEKKKISKKEKIKKIRYYILQYDLHGHYIEKYQNIGCAAESAGISKTSISKVLRGMRNTAGGYIWRKIDAEDVISQTIEIDFDITKTNLGKAKEILSLDDAGNAKQRYLSISEAVRDTGISDCHIQREVKKDGSTEWRDADSI